VVVLGTLGIGAGLALQPLLANFIGGFVLVFEKSIRVGNRIEQGGLYGDVKHIGLRTTTITTNDNVDVIVPNVTLVSSQIINWSHDDPEVRVSVGVGVDYRCDPEKVRDLLLEVARSNPHVLQSRATDVLFEGFGDSAMQFVLRCWTRSHTSRPGVLKSELNFAISRTFRKNAISIPFPQRVLHLRSGWVGGAASREDCDEL
jgi:small-conductance mechanosensitive channel